MKRLVNLSLAAFAALAVVATVLFTAPAAFALTVVEHAYGHLSETDGRWLGSHRLTDGNLGLCLQLTKAPPEGSDTTYVDGASLGWYSADDQARLAYLGRQWVQSHDAIDASAAQLAAWTITGLDGHDDAYYARRANSDAGAVLDRARAMRAEIDGARGASRSVTATVTLTGRVDNGGAGATVQSDLFVDFLAGGVTQLPPGTNTGSITLTGATFDDGSTQQAVTNGQTMAVHPSAGTATSEVTARADYTNLPYGDAFWVAEAPAAVQTLLVPPAGLAEAHASTSGVIKTELPFFPAVDTQTSTQSARVGASIHDTLDLSLAAAPTAPPKAEADEAPFATVQASASGAIAESAPASPAQAATAPAGPSPTATALEPDAARSPAVDRLDEWGTYTSTDGQTLPIPVIIRSTLLGPFDTAPAPAPQAPDGSSVVCRVETPAEHGPGSYSTPDCTVPAAGYYVWTETIDAADTPLEKGGARVRPWKSPFGSATEVTLVATPPPPAPPVAPPTTPPSTETLPPPTATPSSAAILPHQLASTGSQPVPGWVIWAVVAAIATGVAARLVSKHERFHRRRR